MISEDIEAFRRCRILVLGDVMLDHFVRGNVRRISPEAPVPVVEVTDEALNPGGAANVACNLASFTKQASLIGRIGDDMQAGQLKALLHEDGVSTDAMLVSETLPTISKTRIVARQQQIVRVDREKLVWLTEEDVYEVSRRLDAMGPELDAIIIEDYGKGFVTDALAKAVVAVAEKHGLLVTVDPSPRNPLNWSGVHLVKPNRLEAFAAAGVYDSHLPLPASENPELMEVGNILLGKWNTKMVLVTLGEQGMMLFERGKTPHHIPTRAREVYDVSGAGDTAIALLTLALAAGKAPDEAADIANHASGIVVGKLGTACVTPQELVEAMSGDDE